MSIPGAASCCGTCGAAGPHWEVLRKGDVVVTWACDDHLAAECEGLQRDHEVTELIVTDYPKALEWAAIGRALGRIAANSKSKPD